MALSAQGWARTALAGPVAVLASLTIMAGMTQWLPGGGAGIDNVVLPLLLVPLIWAGLFFHACLDRSIARVALISLGLTALHAVLVASHLLASSGRAA